MEATRIDFGFGFDNPAFSDRVLLIEVIPELLDSNADQIDFAQRKRRRRRIYAEVKRVNVNSIILAASSSFFYKLFENGMKETQQREVTMRVCASDVAALMDILEFMYTNTLSSASPDLLRRLIVADKFGVISCMKYCSDLLKALPMSVESALSYLELPASLSQNEVVEPLIVASKKYLVIHFSDFTESQAELMGLPISAVEVVLSGGGLQVYSEDDVLDFILEWARTHYSQSKERIEILTTLLVKCVCFPMMSCSKLKEVLTCSDFAHEQMLELVVEALFLKIEAPSPKDTTINSLDRVYIHGPIRVMLIEESPQPHCVVYFYLSKDECENLPLHDIDSPKFILGGREFSLKAEHCSIEQQNTFAVFLYITLAESESCTVEFEYAIMKKSSKKFHKIRNANVVYSNAILNWGFNNLLEISWNEFMSKDSEYFTNGILQLRVNITIKSSSA